MQIDCNEMRKKVFSSAFKRHLEYCAEKLQRKERLLIVAHSF